LFQHAIRTIIPVQAKAAKIADAPAKKDFKKAAIMKTPNRDLLVLLKNEFASEQAIEHEVRRINHILVQAESAEQFCRAHELVTRRHITSSPKKILRAIRFSELKAFWFLINKN
jgi:hypothetical protein